MRVMAVDYGDARTGIAVSDPAGLLAGFVTVIHSRKPEEVLSQIQRLIQEREVEQIVLGLPRNMDGSEGPRAALCRAFAQQLAQATGLVPRLWDERRSTVEAHQILHTAGKSMKKHRAQVDAVAASLILEGYLNHLRQQGPAPRGGPPPSL